MFLWEKNYAEEFSFTLDTWELQREHLLALASSLHEVMKKGYLDEEPFEVRRAVVKERGGKVRVVTPFPSCVAHLGSYINSWLIGLMSSDWRINPKEAVIGPRFAVDDGERIRSVDLARASDLVPNGVGYAVLRGISRGQGLKGTVFEKFLLKFVSPCRVKDRGGEFITNGSPLMGAGPTWPLLSIYNLWLGWSAFGNRVRAVGDDLLAVGDVLSSAEYDRLLGQTGGEVSVPKDTFSSIAGCLVERFCEVQGGVLAWTDTTSVGSLAGTSRTLSERQLLEQPSFTRGPSLARAPGVSFLTRIIFSKDFGSLKRAGLDPYVPREFGGPGFPGTDAQVTQSLKTLRPHWARALRVVMSQGLGSWSLMSRLVSPWSSQALANYEDLTSWIEEAILAQRAEVGPGATREGESAPEMFSLEAFTKEIEGRMRSSFDLCRGFPAVKHFGITPRSVKRRLDAALDHINGCVPYPRLTDKVKNLEKGLLTFLKQVRGDYYVVPPDLNPHPGIGAAQVGPRKVA